MQMFQKGRSMIEMLGVLAIIGVLSIGGLLGYRRAVNNHHANQILDDANRLAFVIIESNQTFESNDFMEKNFIDSVPYAGTYILDAFMADAEQFGIVVTNVPKGVCEALLPKAAADYNVRTLPAETFDSVEQIMAYGILYNEQNTHICNNVNDVVLYFGNVSKQCNTPDENGNIPCTSNADCCKDYFCWRPLPSACPPAEPGNCTAISRWRAVPVAIMPDNSRLFASHYVISWWSARNWCAARGLKPVSRTDIGCDGLLSCPDSPIVQEIIDTWDGGLLYLETYEEDDCWSYVLGGSSISTRKKHHFNGGYALCH